MLGIFLLLQNVASTFQHDDSDKSKGSASRHDGGVRHLSEATCNLVVKVVLFEGGSQLREVECFFPSDDTFRPIENKPEWLLERLSNNQIASNIDTLYMSEAIIYDSKISIPSGANVYIEEKRDKTNNSDHRRSVTGTKSMVALRVVATDAETTMGVSTLEDEIFGTNGDPFNMRSQYLTCSFNQLDFVPATTSGVTNGVYQVTPQGLTALGTSHTTFQNTVINTANAQLGGTMSSLFDHVMQCLPSGVTYVGVPNWLAVGYVNSYLSLYNDNACGR